MALPELVGVHDVVPAESVDAMVASVRFDLALLNDHVQRAEGEAADLERLVAGAPPVRGDELAAFDGLSAYFDHQTEEVEARRREHVAAGRAEADARLARARDEAVLIRLDGPGIEVPALPVADLLTEASLPAADLADLLHPVLDEAPIVEPVSPIASVLADSDLLEGIDLTELPELLPILEKMIAGDPEPLPSAAPAVTIDAPTASGVLPDAADRFETFWNASEPPAPVKAAKATHWWSVIPFAALLPMLLIVVVIVVLLALIG